MAKFGNLNQDNIDHPMPVDAPLYPNPPYYYKDAQSLSIVYETDEEAALALLPDALSIEGPVTATVMFVKYPFSTLGSYEETILGINCLYQGEERFYIPHIVLNKDAPFAAGREVYGYPKKLAEIEFFQEGDCMLGKMARPAGHPICSAGFRPERPLEIPAEVQGVQVDSYSMALRVIRSPEEKGGSSVSQLIDIKNKMTVKEAWTGTGWIDFHSNSTLDPWHKLRVKKIVSASLQTYDMLLGFGRIIEEY